MIPFLDLAWQNRPLFSKIEKEFRAIFESSAFVLGKPVARFEADFARFIGVPYAIGVASGTDSLVLGLRALDIGVGDEVLLPGNTFIAAAEAIEHVGATPVLADIDPVTREVAMAELERRITKKTKALIVTHLYGQPVDVPVIAAWAKKRKLFIIEDCAQAQGAWVGKKRVGSMGDVGCFSFYPGKNLGAFGDAGAVTTHRSDLEARIRMLRNHGCKTKYEHEEVGYNSRLDGLQATVLSIKLAHLDRWNRLRQEVAAAYATRLASVPCVRPPFFNRRLLSVHHLYIIEVPPATRDALRTYLHDQGVETGVHYPIPIHLTGAFAHLKLRAGSLPGVEMLAASCLSLPMYPGLKKSDVRYIAGKIKDFYSHSTSI